ncbi:unnamed protein product [Brassica oleracea]
MRTFNRYIERLEAKNPNTNLKARDVKKITSGTRRSRKLTMPLFSDLHQRLPSLLHSTVTVYIHLTVTRIEKTDRYRTTLRRGQNHNRSWHFF